MLKWRELIVTSSDGDQTDNLGAMVDRRDSHLSTIEMDADGSIEGWMQWFISAPGEEPDWDTPRDEVDWSGFEEALKEALA